MSKPHGKCVRISQPKQPYMPRNYVDEKTLAPRVDLYGDRLSKRSQQAQL
jgi:hypothetical protein